jgi:beta-lactamase regulating signal transducer with metallopeptidase domain
MLPFQHILSQLGYALINSFWQMALLLGGYILITSVYKLSAAARFRWASLLSLSGIVWFFATLFLPAQPPQFFASTIVFIKVGGIQTMVDFTLYALSCCYLIWLGFSILLLSVKWKELGKTNIIRNQKVPARWRLFVEQHASMLAIPQKVRMHISTHVSPATFGWIKPIILLPASCLTQLSTKQMEALLLHELAHIRRYDYLVNSLLTVAEKLLFFNPFLRKLVNEARAECEHACDDMVLQFNYPAIEYSGALLAIAKESLQLTPALQATGNQSHLLYGRICRILHLPVSTHKLSSKNLLIFFALPIIAICVTLPQQTTKDMSVQKETGSLIFWKKHSVPTYELQWKRSLFNARMDLFASAIGRIEPPALAATAVSIKKNSAEMDKQFALVQQAEEEIKKTEKEMEIRTTREQGSMVLSASWAQQQEETNNDIEQLPSLGWKPMQVLLDKLETERKLNEEEWEKLAGLITVHNEIRMAIVKDANRNTEEWVTNAAVTKVETNAADEVLVIVYDEITGTLAASVVPRNQLNMDVQLENNLTPDERQVILLRRKAEGKSKIISL